MQTHCPEADLYTSIKHGHLRQGTCLSPVFQKLNAFALLICSGKENAATCKEKPPKSGGDRAMSIMALSAQVQPLLAPSSELQDVNSISAWQRIGKQLGLNVGVLRNVGGAGRLSSEAVQSLRTSMCLEGYIKLTDISLGCSLNSMCDAIDCLRSAGLPPQFVLVFDEAWLVASRVSAMLTPVYGLANIHDFFVFDVPPGGAGWGAHRDRPGKSFASGFSADGTPKYITVWVPLTDASTSTSCMYVVPAPADPEYAQGGEPVVNVIASSHQHIRALPVSQGCALAWSHRLIHWGSASPPKAHRRMAMSFAMASADFETSVLQLPSEQLPPFECRLALIAFSLLFYHHSQPVPATLRCTLLRIIEEHAQFLSTESLLSEAKSIFAHNVATIRNDATSEEEQKAAEAVCRYLDSLRNESPEPPPQPPQDPPCPSSPPAPPPQPPSLHPASSDPLRPPAPPMLPPPYAYGHAKSLVPLPPPPRRRTPAKVETVSPQPPPPPPPLQPPIET